MTENNVEFTPVETGDMTKIPLEANNGEWVVSAKVKKSKTQKDGYPMLIIEYRLLEANTDGNEFQTGGRVSEFVNFPPRQANNYRMACQQIATIAAMAGTEVPSTASLANGSWSDLEPFIEAIEANKHTIWTKAKKRTDTGEDVVTVLHKNPSNRLGGGTRTTSDDDSPKGKRGRRS